MKERIKEKIEVIEKNLDELEEYLPETLEEYKNDQKTILACERLFEMIMESLIDINLLVIKFKRFQLPNDDSSTFSILNDNKIISERIMKNLISAKGMRNFIAHQYEKIDDEIVYEALKEHFSDDVKLFIKEIKLNIQT